MKETEEFFGYEKYLKVIANNGLIAQIEKENDYFDDDGMLICGVCNKPRQMMRELKTSVDGIDRYIVIKTTCDCDCDKAKKAKEDEIIEKQKKAERLRWRKLYSTMESRYLSATFENYDVLSKQDNYNEMLNYAKNFKEMTKGNLEIKINGHSIMMPKNQGLIFYGDVGTGKTYSAACIANYLMENGMTVYMTSFSKILEEIQGDREKEKEISKKIVQSDLVVFDDLGAERNTSYALEKVFNYLDMRYKSNKPMIITTNMTILELANVSEIEYRRVTDRILEVCTPIEFKGISRRTSKNNSYFMEFLKKEN